MRLRWSGEVIGYDINIAGLVDESVDIGVPGGRELIRLVDAFVSGTDPDRESARQAVLDVLGPESLFDSATVFGNFEMMKALGLYDILKSQHTQINSTP